MRNVFLASLLLLPGQAFAGPPERVSGRMARDEVAEWCRQYRREQDDERRLGLMDRLGTLLPSRDPRMAVVLGETLEEAAVAYMKNPEDFRVSAWQAWFLLRCHYVPAHEGVGEWWKAHKDDLYRRAKKLPQ